MPWYSLTLVVVAFAILEILSSLSFKKRRKVSEASSIGAYILGAWAFTGDETWAVVFGVGLLLVAVICDLSRRRVRVADR